MATMIQSKAVLYISEIVTDSSDKQKRPKKKAHRVTSLLSRPQAPLASGDARTGKQVLESKPNPPKELR